MWPVHCVQGSSGAEFHADLQRAAGDIVVRKGMNSRIDSYSGFFDNDHKNQTEMNEVLKQHGMSESIDSFSSFNSDLTCSHISHVRRRIFWSGITHVYLVGVATDYCVGYSALDALAGGFDTTLVCIFTFFILLQQFCSVFVSTFCFVSEYQVEDGARGVAPDTTTDMLAQLKSKGVKVINSSQLNQGESLK